LNLGTEISFLNSVVYFLLQKLLSVIKELESLKLIVRQEISKLNSNADAEEPNGVYEICASSSMEQNVRPYKSKVYMTSCAFSLFFVLH
jgi:hypothetical protein